MVQIDSGAYREQIDYKFALIKNKEKIFPNQKTNFRKCIVFL